MNVKEARKLAGLTKEEVLKKYNLPPLQVEKLLDEPELAAQIEEIKKQELEKEKNN